MDFMSTADHLRFGMAFNTGFVHMNNAGIAPMLRSSLERMVHASQLMSQEGYFSFPELHEEYEKSRARVARLTGAQSAEDVAFFSNCAAALTQVAYGLDLKEGDEVVTWDEEYPSAAYPWHAVAKEKDLTLTCLPMEEDYSVRTEKMIEAITPKTKVVSVSWFQYLTGSESDLPALSQACKKVGAWLVVDAIQGLGVVPFDLRQMGVDAVCGGAQKWLCGPMGVGFLALAPGRAQELKPILHGAFTYGKMEEPPTAFDPELKAHPNALRFEPGTPPLVPALGLGAAIDFLLDLGIDKVHEAALGHAKVLRQELLSQGARILSTNNQRSPIVTFVPKMGTENLTEILHKNQVGHSPRAGGIRLSPHGFNTQEDLDRVLKLTG